MQLEMLSVVSFGPYRGRTLRPEKDGRVVLPAGWPEELPFSFFLYLWYGVLPSFAPAETAQGDCTVLTAAGERLSLSRRGTAPARLTAEKDGKTWEADSPGEDVFGVSAEIFRRTVLFSGYGEDGAPEKRIAAEEARLRASGAADENLDAACAALSVALDRLSAREGSGGAYALLAAERAKKEKQCDAAKAHRADVLVRENQIFRNKNRQNEAEAELDKFRRLESDFRSACMIREYDALHERELEEDQREKEEALYRRTHSYEGFAPDVSFLAELAEKKHALECAEKEYEEARALFAAEKGKTDPLNEKESRMAEIFSHTDGEAVLALCRKERRKAALAQLFFLMLCVLFLPLGAGFVFLLTRGLISAALLCATFAAFAVGGGALALYERHMAGMRLSYLFMSCLATDEEELKRNIALAGEASARRALQKQEKEAAEIGFYRRAEERSAAYEALSAVAARWGRSLRCAGGAQAAVEALSRDAGEYIRKSNALNMEKAEAAAKVRALRQKLNESSEVAVRARIAPKARLKLCNLNETDLRHGVEHYAQLVAEYAEKGKALMAAAEADGAGADPVRIREEISLLEEKMTSLAAQREACAVAYARLQEKRPAGEQENNSVKAPENALLYLTQEKLKVCRRTYREMPPLFLAAEPLPAVRNAWQLAGVSAAGQCVIPVLCTGKK